METFKATFLELVTIPVFHFVAILAINTIFFVFKGTVFSPDDGKGY